VRRLLRPLRLLNVNFDGRSIQAKNNVDISYLNSSKLNVAMDRAAALSGSARVEAYAKLDRNIMQNYAPWVPYGIVNDAFFVSSRVHNYVYSSYTGEPDFNALSVG
jgi:hypothetical protein